MNELSRTPVIEAGALSPDGYFYWNGAQWKSTVSPDGAWRWNGAAWVAMQSPFESIAAEPYVSPKELGVWVSVLLGISGAVTIVEALFVNDFVAFTGWAGDLRFRYSVGFIGLLMFAVTAVLFLVWFHRSYRNLTVFGTHDLQFSPAWAVGWWFIPVAGLWQPYRAALEIWEASNPIAARATFSEPGVGVGSSTLIRLWWAAWLVCLLLFNVAAFAAPDNSVIYWQSALYAHATVLAAVLAILFVTSVGARQENRWRQLASMSPPA